ncbi:Ubiquinone/menaquinone biosynthesis C-methylase UbiE [Gracilibacillus orientalis]|uniref:Ubiquinone/menaquinone biosynthesis C-methylase UbiE n=1 Tax=Gracilibacillus orientalis TaxID=334253 RepID=A0A1I4I042_9BACI|nr:class I SAM-dependent methyltransferase [Gracilibacillus orientalis]SFL47221.1 Ubiquinone/menaquinone biosynthesis C-methylase UbiE [Gracilibacillus orientalis]
MKKEKLIKKYDKQVKVYEKNRNHSTLSTWRKKLINKAYGNVLEVGVGAGANFPYYTEETVQVTGVDFSSEMIKSAKQAASDYHFRAEFLQEDVDHLTLAPNSYDCIVSTLSLCSYAKPHELMNKFNDWCREDGIVLLMEHGLSSNLFLSYSQKILDPLFTKISGCHCNRDILKIVEKSDLQLINIETYWSGIVYMICAKPNKN